MSRYLKISTLFSLALLMGCALKPTRYVYREEGPDVYYLSKEKFPFKARIHGINWKVEQVRDNTIVMSRSEPNPTIINFYEYDENFLDKRFFKDDLTDAQSLREYAKAEFSFYKKRGEAPVQVAENVQGPLKPNFMWAFTTTKGEKVYNITTARDFHLINISYESQSPKAADELLDIFRSITPLSKSEAVAAIEAIQDKNGD